MAIGGNPRRKDPATGVADRGGHMSHVPTAAYDPVFWMHHWSDLNALLLSLTDMFLVLLTAGQPSGKRRVQTIIMMGNIIHIRTDGTNQK